MNLKYLAKQKGGRNSENYINTIYNLYVSVDGSIIGVCWWDRDDSGGHPADNQNGTYEED